jgi:type II secretory pathway component GspD/PulD (secretin)
MKTQSSPYRLGKALWAGLCLVLVLTADPSSTLGASRAPFTFENADIAVVIADVARRTGSTFLFDPARVKGTITVLSPGDVTPAQALELLRSALALHGYAIVSRAQGSWIVPVHDIATRDFVIQVIPLTYADAGEVASTLSWVAPPGVRVAPYLPANSVVIAGHAAAVERMRNAIRGR